MSRVILRMRSAVLYPSVMSWVVTRLSTSRTSSRASTVSCGRSRTTAVDTSTRSVWWGRCRTDAVWSTTPLTRTSCTRRSGRRNWPTLPAATRFPYHSTSTLRFRGTKIYSGRCAGHTEDTLTLWPWFRVGLRVAVPMATGRGVDFHPDLGSGWTRPLLRPIGSSPLVDPNKF